MAEINPTVTAKQLATAYTAQSQAMLDAQTKSAQANSAALTKLQTALQDFDTSLKSLSGKKSMTQYSAALSDTSVGSATAGVGAQPGTYPIFVEQVASRHQIAFADLPAVPAIAGGSMTVRLGNGAAFNVDLASADVNGDGTLSQAEIARAINSASENKGAVTALLMTVNGQIQLTLTAGASGADGEISLDTDGLLPSPLKDKLSAAPKELTPAHDAVYWLGPQGTGLRVQQSDNTVTAIQGVTLTLSKAMKEGDPPATLSVTKDDSATSTNVKTFVDGYNALQKTLDELTAIGSRESGKESGTFAQDAGVRALRTRLSGLLRQDFDGHSLLDLGISADRYGKLSLDETKLERTLGQDPTALDAAFGSAAPGATSGALGAYGVATDQWLNSGTGQIKQRQTSTQSIQKSIGERQTRLDSQYAQSYDRYLRQYSNLQALQSRMTDTTSMLKNLSQTSSSDSN